MRGTRVEGHSEDSGERSEHPEPQAFPRIHRLIAQYERVNAQWRRHFGISANERLALTHIVNSGEVTAADLTRRIGMTSAALTTLVDRLETAGMVKRVPDPKDRRRILLYPTRKTLRGTEAIIGPVARELEVLLASYPEQVRDGIVEFLHRAGGLFDEHADRVDHT